MKKNGFIISLALFILCTLFVVILAYKEVIKIELTTIIISLLAVALGNIFYRQQVLLENSIRTKTETYDKYIESLSNYIFRNSGEDEVFKNYQIGRFKLCLYASDETVKAFLSVVPESVKYDVEDGVSKILYAIRKEVNPGTKIKNNEMAGIDPAQWRMDLTTTNK
ncbi:MAG: hypothetical protein WCJ39_08605 [bacterium]